MDVSTHDVAIVEAVCERLREAVTASDPNTRHVALATAQAGVQALMLWDGTPEGEIQSDKFAAILQEYYLPALTLGSQLGMTGRYVGP